MPEADIRASDLYREINTVNEALRQPGTGQISDAAEVHVSPDGTQAVFAGVIMDKLEGTPPTRIAVTDLVTSDTQVLTFGLNVDRLPKFSPDGRQIAFFYPIAAGRAIFSSICWTRSAAPRGRSHRWTAGWSSAGWRIQPGWV